MHATMGAAGALLGAGFGLAARARAPTGEVRVLAVGLAVAALIYVGFAAAGAAQGRWVLVESAGLAAFAVLAWLGVRRSPMWVVAGWLLHVAWDVGLHRAGQTPFVPSWYPPLCVGFDLVVALWATVRWRELRATADS